MKELRQKNSTNILKILILPNSLQLMRILKIEKNSAFRGRIQSKIIQKSREVHKKKHKTLMINLSSYELN